MSIDTGGVALLEPHRVRTVNVSVNSANKIHDDVTAARYGFRGGLVAGTLVYAHMTTPLVQRLGTAWLDGSVSELKLLQPAYDGEWLTVEGGIQAGSASEPSYRVVVRNEAGAELATLETRRTDELPAVDERAAMVPADAKLAPLPIAWDAVHVGAPLRALQWAPTQAEQDSWCDAASDALPLYRSGARPRIHPGLVLQGANRVFGEHFILNPWIHTGSHIIQRSALCLGDPIEIRAMPIDKWERKGHELVKLYVVFLNGGRPAVEVYHSAIFTVRPSQV
jgi:hypothetical protein